ncbi:MAG: Lrp/AsnC family transcriptional regulator [Candidatus Thermoplasmatota archaeon]|nr:Lrp/AsnC family transcriptional regulator [Candidatus Thermoplasmatota archaeon]
MSDKKPVDEKDATLIEFLKKNGRAKIGDISRATDIPRATIFERINKLTESGIIRNFTVDLDYEKLGYSVTSYIMISYDPSSETKQEDLCVKLSRLENVIGVWIISGEWDIMILTVQRSIREMSTFVVNTLRNMDGILRTETFVVFQSFR